MGGSWQWGHVDRHIVKYISYCQRASHWLWCTTCHFWSYRLPFRNSCSFWFSRWFREIRHISLVKPLVTACVVIKLQSSVHSLHEFYPYQFFLQPWNKSCKLGLGVTIIYNCPYYWPVSKWSLFPLHVIRCWCSRVLKWYIISFIKWMNHILVSISAVSPISVSLVKRLTRSIGLYTCKKVRTMDLPY